LRERNPEYRERPTLGALVIATSNPAKLERFRTGLGEHFQVDLSSFADEGLEKTDEPYETARENARHKALTYYQQCRKPVIAVDEALFLDFLSPEKQPGIHVRRIGGGEEVSDEELLARVIRLLKKSPPENRWGRWHFAVCVVRSENQIAEGEFEEEIEFSTEPSSQKIPGYPLSRIGIRPEFGKPGSELSDEESKQADKNYMSKVREIISSAYGLPVDNF